jgi:uncharacterized protein DUF4339
MYKIIGADQKEYGPISADQIRQWIAEGRVDGQTVACAEGTQDWKPLRLFPEFGFTAAPAAPPIPGAASSPPIPLEEIKAQDYSLDIMSCISRAWALMKNNFGTVFVTFLLFIGLTVGSQFLVNLILSAAGVGHLPLTKRMYFSPITIIFTSLVIGPARGGLFQVYLSLLRGQSATAGDLMKGFKSFQDLFLANLITAIITTACTFPYLMAAAAQFQPHLEAFQQQIKEHPSTPPDFHELFSSIASSYSSHLPLLLIGIIPSTYLLVNLMFMVPLIIDKQVSVRSGFAASWKIVHKHWFHIFGLTVLAGLIYFAGGFMCCIGVLATGPLSLLAICYAYEDIFGRKAA